MSLQPTFGKLYSYYNVKYLFLGALVTFELGSIICAVAPSSTGFILGRVVAGIGAAAIYAGGMTIISYAVPLTRISVYLAVLSSASAVAAMVGPPLGGVFTDSKRLTWRFCFWISLRKSVIPFAGVNVNGDSIRGNIDGVVPAGIPSKTKEAVDVIFERKNSQTGSSWNDPVHLQHHMPVFGTDMGWQHLSLV